MEQYEYDLAISYLRQDQIVADEIYRKLSSKYKIFHYSNYQDRLAGQDGEEVLSRIFQKEARMVVILYRSEWCKGEWTRIEETGIRNRGYEQGYDFALFVKMDSIIELPKYFPKNRIWYGLNEYGMDGLNNVIQYKIGELGGDTRTLTIDQLVRLKENEMYTKVETERYLNSAEARNDGLRLFQEMIQTADEEMNTILRKNKTCFFKLGANDKKIITFHGEKCDSTIWLFEGENLHPIIQIELHKKNTIIIHSTRKEYTSMCKKQFKYSIEYEKKGWLYSDKKLYTNKQIVDMAIEMLLNAH